VKQLSNGEKIKGTHTKSQKYRMTIIKELRHSERSEVPLYEMPHMRKIKAANLVVAMGKLNLILFTFNP